MPRGPHIMVLGPSRDHRGKTWPLDLRRDAIRLLQQRRASAVLMEDVPDVPGENPARKFDRVVAEYNVKTFLVVWPKACRLNGLDVEFGFLLKEIVAGKLDAKDVKLVTHVKNVSIDDASGKFQIGEEGNRTRYYEALLDEGCLVYSYESGAHYLNNVFAVGLDHIQRHIAGVAETDFVGQTAVRLKARQPLPQTNAGDSHT